MSSSGERKIEDSQVSVPDSIKLTVVGHSEGGYLVNYNSDFRDERVRTLSEVIGYMSKLGRPVLKAEPTYAYLQENEKEIVEAVRQALTRREDLVREGWLTRNYPTMRA